MSKIEELEQELALRTQQLAECTRAMLGAVVRLREIESTLARPSLLTTDATIECADRVGEVADALAAAVDRPPKPPDDAVNHPSHYTRGKIEVVDFIEDQGLGFNLGQVVKYVARAGFKDPSKDVEDLKKAAFYLERQIRLLSATKERGGGETCTG